MTRTSTHGAASRCAMFLVRSLYFNARQIWLLTTIFDGAGHHKAAVSAVPGGDFHQGGVCIA